MENRIKNYIKTKLKKITSSVEGTSFITGILRSGHYVRLYGDSSAQAFFLQIGREDSFDRWSNSADVQSELPFSWSDKDIKNKIDETIKLSKILFKNVPSKYWNKFLKVTF